jgi:hypothetical protein
MPMPSFLDFTPVPRRARYDGWSPELQRRFIAALARGERPGEAAERLGMSRQSAYKLRRRRGAQSFAAAWDSALRLARQARSPRRVSQDEAAPRFRSADEAAAVAAAGYDSVQRAAAQSPAAARAAFDRMLASLYGPDALRFVESVKGDKGDGIGGR